MGETGRPEIVEGFNKAGQDVLHVLSSPYDPTTGFGNKAYSESVFYVEASRVNALFSSDISNAISSLQRRQRLLASDQLPKSEKIAKMKHVQVSLFPGGVDYTVDVLVVEASALTLHTALRVDNSHQIW